MRSSAYYLIRIPVHGRPEIIPVPEQNISAEQLAALLQTDVTERMRVPAVPDSFPEESVLCYFIDARGGERELPANFIGTCFYHTGCPIFGDLLLAQSSAGGDVISGFSEETAAIVDSWIRTQFRDYFNMPETI